METIQFIVLALATWRISSLFVNESGPFHLFQRVREWAGITHDEDGNVFMIPDTLRAGVLSCVWCFSVWAGAFWTLAWLVSPMAFFVALPLALSAVAVIVDRITN